MEIKDLKAKQGKVNMVVEVTEIGDVREFTKFGKTGRVCNATVKDATGETKITLWNEDIDTMKVGDKVKIENGWVNEFQGQLQITKGKFGKFEVGSGSEEAEPVPEAPTEPTAEEAVAEEKVE